jgi:hypothetical protein
LGKFLRWSVVVSATGTRSTGQRHWGTIFGTRAAPVTRDSLSRRQRDRTGGRLLVAVLGLLPAVAIAHVKWFVNYDLLSPPRPALGVISSHYFMLFSICVGPLIFAISLLDQHLTQKKGFLDRRAEALTEQISTYFPLLLRLGVAAFFTAVFAYGCFHEWMILTPELRTHSVWVCWIQLAIALFALTTRTAVLSGVGIVFLYSYGVAQYGVFHMLDYPIFLGVAAYLIIYSIYGRKREALAQGTVRVSTAITLLWASIEKFAFPEWSFMLMTDRPGMVLGFDPEFYMVAAGFVEFCAAFLLITGSLAARLAALVLFALFVSAILPFGVIDAIGHSVIIVVLMMLILSNNGMAWSFNTHRSNAVTATLQTSIFFGTLFLFVGLYYAGYYISYELKFV